MDGQEGIPEGIREQLEGEGYDYALAVATDAEVAAGAACGQLGIIEEELAGN